MKKLIIAFVLSALPVVTFGAGGGVHLDSAHVDLSDKASLQRGAKLFVNYCLGCHSLAYQRYNRMGKDLGLTDDQVEENLMFTGDKVGETMTIAMTKQQGTDWFGNPPPDLSVIARARGADWLYTYLRTFYLDDSRPFGVNNKVFPDVGMPHVLWELEGLKKPTHKTIEHSDGSTEEVVAGFEQVTEGKLSPAEYDQAVRDLVGFLVYTGEPAKLERYSIGVGVLIFLAVFFVIAFLLKKEYWRDIH